MELIDGDIVLLQTGWAERYADDDTETYIDRHPGQTADAGQWLTETRGIHVLAIDAPNVEIHANRNTIDVHNQLYRRHREDPRLIIESVTNLSALPDSVCSVVAYPPPIDAVSNHTASSRITSTPNQRKRRSPRKDLTDSRATL